jgi:hypothetical protein
MSTTNYKHSELFAKLKSIEESIPDNLTSYQYLSVLDELIFNGLYPLIEGTKFFENFLAQILGWQTINSKRKVVGVGRQAFSSYLTLFFLLENPKQRLKLIKKMKIDRSVLFEAMRRWSSIAEEIHHISDTEIITKDVLVQIADLSERASMRDSHHVMAIYNQVHYWHEQATSFKSQILEKYTRLCLTTAQRDYVQMNCQGDLDDIIQIYFMSAGKAIDKCDTDKGVLTTHIQNWLLSAKNVVIATYNNGVVSHSNSKSSLKDKAKDRAKLGAEAGKELIHTMGTGTSMGTMSVDAVSLDEIEDMIADDLDDSRDKEDTINQIRRVTKYFDKTGIGRILLGIQDILSEEDVQTLRALAL